MSTQLAAPLQFNTPDTGPFSFLHFADSGEGHDEQLQLARQMRPENVSLVLANGDLAYESATYASIEANYYSIYREMMAQTPFFATLGNHEYYTGSGAPSLAGRATPTGGIERSDWGRYYYLRLGQHRLR